MERKSNINYIIGLIFIVPGLFLLMDKLNIFNIRELLNFSFIIKSFWATMFLLIPGIFLHILFFAGGKTTPSYIIMGGILTFIGVVAQISYSYGLWGKLWPGFFLAIAFGLFEYYIFGKRERGVIMAVIVITGISAILISKTLTNSFYGDYIFAMVLISLGLAIIFGNSPRRGRI